MKAGLADWETRLGLISDEVLAYHKARAKSTRHALRAGLLLNEAKAEVPHGDWGAYVEQAGVAERTARRWMRLAGARMHPRTIKHHGGLRGAEEHLGTLLATRNDALEAIAGRESAQPCCKANPPGECKWHLGRDESMALWESMDDVELGHVMNHAADAAKGWEKDCPEASACSDFGPTEFVAALDDAA